MLEDAGKYNGGAELTLLDSSGAPAVTYKMTGPQIRKLIASAAKPACRSLGADRQSQAKEPEAEGRHHQTQ